MSKHDARMARRALLIRRAGAEHMVFEEGKLSMTRGRWERAADEAEERARKALARQEWGVAEAALRRAARAHYALSALTNGAAQAKHLEWAHELRGQSRRIASRVRYSR
jgi:hypothetical protein